MVARVVASQSPLGSREPNARHLEFSAKLELHTTNHKEEHGAPSNQVLERPTRDP